MIKLSPIFVATLLLAAAVPAHAQANACKNKVFIDTIYGHQTAPGRYEYILQLRNLTKKPLGYQLDFKNMPSGVNVFKATMPSTAPLAAGSGAVLRIGSGTNANINSNSVSIGYDTPGSAVTISNCK